MLRRASTHRRQDAEPQYMTPTLYQKGQDAPMFAVPSPTSSLHSNVVASPSTSSSGSSRRTATSANALPTNIQTLGANGSVSRLPLTPDTISSSSPSHPYSTPLAPRVGSAKFTPQSMSLTSSALLASASSSPNASTITSTSMTQPARIVRLASDASAATKGSSSSIPDINNSSVSSPYSSSTTPTTSAAPSSHTLAAPHAPPITVSAHGPTVLAPHRLATSTSSSSARRSLPILNSTCTGNAGSSISSSSSNGNGNGSISVTGLVGGNQSLSASFTSSSSSSTVSKVRPRSSKANSVARVSAPSPSPSFSSSSSPSSSASLAALGPSLNQYQASMGGVTSTPTAVSILMQGFPAAPGTPFSSLSSPYQSPHQQHQPYPSHSGSTVPSSSSLAAQVYGLASSAPPPPTASSSIALLVPPTLSSTLSPSGHPIAGQGIHKPNSFRMSPSPIPAPTSSTPMMQALSASLGSGLLSASSERDISGWSLSPGQMHRPASSASSSLSTPLAPPSLSLLPSSSPLITSLQAGTRPARSRPSSPSASAILQPSSSSSSSSSIPSAPITESSALAASSAAIGLAGFKIDASSAASNGSSLSTFSSSSIPTSASSSPAIAPTARRSSLTTPSSPSATLSTTNITSTNIPSVLSTAVQETTMASRTTPASSPVTQQSSTPPSSSPSAFPTTPLLVSTSLASLPVPPRKLAPLPSTSTSISTPTSTSTSSPSSTSTSSPAVSSTPSPLASTSALSAIPSSAPPLSSSSSSPSASPSPSLNRLRSVRSSRNAQITPTTTTTATTTITTTITTSTEIQPSKATPPPTILSPPPPPRPSASEPVSPASQTLPARSTSSSPTDTPSSSSSSPSSSSSFSFTTPSPEPSLSLSLSRASSLVSPQPPSEVLPSSPTFSLTSSSSSSSSVSSSSSSSSSSLSSSSSSAAPPPPASPPLTPNAIRATGRAGGRIVVTSRRRTSSSSLSSASNPATTVGASTSPVSSLLSTVDVPSDDKMKESASTPGSASSSASSSPFTSPEKQLQPASASSSPSSSPSSPSVSAVDDVVTPKPTSASTPTSSSPSSPPFEATLEASKPSPLDNSILPSSPSPSPSPPPVPSLLVTPSSPSLEVATPSHSSSSPVAFSPTLLEAKGYDAQVETHAETRATEKVQQPKPSSPSTSSLLSPSSSPVRCDSPPPLTSSSTCVDSPIRPDSKTSSSTPSPSSSSSPSSASSASAPLSASPAMTMYSSPSSPSLLEFLDSIKAQQAETEAANDSSSPSSTSSMSSLPALHRKLRPVERLKSEFPTVREIMKTLNVDLDAYNVVDPAALLPNEISDKKAATPSPVGNSESSGSSGPSAGGASAGGGAPVSVKRRNSQAGGRGASLTSASGGAAGGGVNRASAASQVTAAELAEERRLARERALQVQMEKDYLISIGMGDVAEGPAAAAAAIATRKALEARAQSQRSMQTLMTFHQNHRYFSDCFSSSSIASSSASAAVAGANGQTSSASSSAPQSSSSSSSSGGAGSASSSSSTPTSSSTSTSPKPMTSPTRKGFEKRTPTKAGRAASATAKETSSPTSSSSTSAPPAAVKSPASALSPPRSPTKHKTGAGGLLDEEAAEAPVAFILTSPPKIVARHNKAKPVPPSSSSSSLSSSSITDGSNASSRLPSGAENNVAAAAVGGKDASSSSQNALTVPAPVPVRSPEQIALEREQQQQQIEDIVNNCNAGASLPVAIIRHIKKNIDNATSAARLAQNLATHYRPYTIIDPASPSSSASSSASASTTALNRPESAGSARKGKDGATAPYLVFSSGLAQVLYSGGKRKNWTRPQAIFERMRTATGASSSASTSPTLAAGGVNDTEAAMIIHRVFEYLTIPELAAASQVCASFSLLALSHSLWSRTILRVYPRLSHHLSTDNVSKPVQGSTSSASAKTSTAVGNGKDSKTTSTSNSSSSKNGSASRADPLSSNTREFKRHEWRIPGIVGLAKRHYWGRMKIEKGGFVHNSIRLHPSSVTVAALTPTGVVTTCEAGSAVTSNLRMKPGQYAASCAATRLVCKDAQEHLQICAGMWGISQVHVAQPAPYHHSPPNLAHSHAISGVLYRGGGKVATISYDHSAKIWASDSGAHLRTLRGHTGPLTCIAGGRANLELPRDYYSLPNEDDECDESDGGNHKDEDDDDDDADIDSEKTLKNPAGEQKSSLASSTCSSSTVNKTQRALQRVERRRRRQAVHCVSGVLDNHMALDAYSDTPLPFFTGSRDGTVRMWHPSRSTALAVFPGTWNHPPHVPLPPSASLASTAPASMPIPSLNDTLAGVTALAVWDGCEPGISAPPPGWLDAQGLAPEPTLLGVGDDHGDAAFYDISKQARIWRGPVAPGNVRSIVFGEREGPPVCLTAGLRTAALIDLRAPPPQASLFTTNVLAPLAGPRGAAQSSSSSLSSSGIIFGGHGGSVTQTSFLAPRCPRFSHHIMTSSEDGRIRIFDIRSPSTPTYVIGGHTAGVTCFDIHYSGEYLLSGSRDRTLRLTSLAKPGMPNIKTLLGHKGSVTWAQFGGVFHPDKLLSVDAHGCLAMWS